jgi:hypothetical protein
MGFHFGGLLSTGREQGLVLGQHFLKSCWDPDPTAKVEKQLWFVERREGRGQPNPLERGGVFEEQILLEGGKGCPP